MTELLYLLTGLAFGVLAGVFFTLAAMIDWDKYSFEDVIFGDAKISEEAKDNVVKSLKPESFEDFKKRNGMV